MNVSPKTGGGDFNKSPRSGSKSAPSEAPAVRDNTQPRNPRSSKAAAGVAPGVRSGVSIPSNGDRDTPTSVKSNIVDQKAPTHGSKDSSIERKI